MEVKQLICLWAGVALAAGFVTPATAADEDAANIVVRRLTPPPIVGVTVTTPSQHVDFKQGTDCSNFALEPRHVRLFLRQARAVSKHSFQQDLDWTECRASGVVRYANGMRAEWSIEIGGRGALTPSNGRRKGVTYYLNCDACSGFGKPE